jgi:hypothetical protein
MVASTSWLPDPEIVAAFGRAVFPTLRTSRNSPLFSTLKDQGFEVAMYDTNVTPEWALTWSHGIFGTRPKGWTVAHVWPNPKDHLCYTHLANLALVPECLNSTTDKAGPLTEYLRYHSWEKYRWKPSSEAEPIKPSGYDAVRVRWRYLASPGRNPLDIVKEKFLSLDNQRTRALQPIMKRLGYLG